MPINFPRPIVSVDELASLLGDASTRERVRPVDVRWKLGASEHGRLAFESGHLPGAIFLDLETDLSDPGGLGAPGRHPLPDPSAFARLLGDVGIADDSYVVAYDDAGGTVAARLWWMLDDLGHAAVAVLDGGIDAWREAGLEPTTGPASWPATTIHLHDRWTRTIERDALAARLDEVVLLDVRARERYRGEVEPIDPIAGHIPTARSAPTTESLDAGRMRPASELATAFERLGAADGSEVVVACGSGVNACHAALALRIAGLPSPTLYAGSYSDWSRSGLPVETGDDPGPPDGRATPAG
ncbi:MAG TPA: sulfurtransferase [Candidatus Limnocylindrales bacterium]|nr:sulfurtransferase [Candidatus Limnocylindrales bacterium]